MAKRFAQICFFSICISPAWIQVVVPRIWVFEDWNYYDFPYEVNPASLASVVTLVIISLNYRRLEQKLYHPRVALLLLSLSTFLMAMGEFLYEAHE